MKSHKNDLKEDTRIALLEQSIGHINESLIRVEKRFDNIDKHLIDIRNDMFQSFKDINTRMWVNFFWILSGFVGILGLMAHGFEWI